MVRLGGKERNPATGVVDKDASASRGIGLAIVFGCFAKETRVHALDKVGLGFLFRHGGTSRVVIRSGTIVGRYERTVLFPSGGSSKDIGQEGSIFFSRHAKV